MKQYSMANNPIREGFYPDPSVLRVGDDYYMVNSSFVYFPCIPISHSKDLVNWETVGHAVTNPQYVDLDRFDCGRGFWAPDISYSNGKYYIVATLRGNDDWVDHHRQMIVYADKPEGPYSEPVFFDVGGIDPSLFHDDDGKHYLLLNPGVTIYPLSDDCLSITGPSRMLWEGWSKIKTEGPHLLKKDGWYYIFAAEGGTGDGHHISVARAKALTDEFEPCPHNPIIKQDNPYGVLQRTGHGNAFDTPFGDWYMVFLCSRKQGGRYSLLGRETALAKLTWDEEGWPLLNDGKGPLESVPVPGDIRKKDCPVKTYGLSKKLSKDFVTSRGEVFIRQTKIDCDVNLVLFPKNVKEGDFGLMFYYDENSWMKFAISNKDGKSILYILEQNVEVSNEPLTLMEGKLDEIPTHLELKVETRGLEKTFLYSINHSSFVEATHRDNCALLCDEGLTTGKRFTGPMIGLWGFLEYKAAFIDLKIE